MDEKKKVIPVELEIPVEDVIKRYKITEALEIVRTTHCIFFHSTCFWVVSKPTMANSLRGGALYEMLTWYCDYQDDREQYTKEKQERYDTLCSVIATILTLPMDVFTDIDFTLDVANYILERRTAYYEALAKEAEQEKPDTLEDALDNARFEAEVMAAEEMKDEARRLNDGDEA